MFENVLPVFAIVCCTAYNATFEQCGKSDAITASMTRCTEGRTIAADHLPFGTRVVIDGHIYTVEDRFGGSHTNKIDIYMDSEEAAWKFGKQWKIVRIIYPEKKPNIWRQKFEPFPVTAGYIRRENNGKGIGRYK